RVPAGQARARARPGRWLVRVPAGEPGHPAPPEHREPPDRPEPPEAPGATETALLAHPAQAVAVRAARLVAPVRLRREALTGVLGARRERVATRRARSAAPAGAPAADGQAKHQGAAHRGGGGRPWWRRLFAARAGGA